ncbi:hypothetical protein [Halolamina salifodinae]|uniref:Uncharacterized protein n=1 Tax=Halolamina salifodinae TaxID=1202767 RepID=A0A8T4H0W1_9EURY|nr:hypothetical protein [Halolamina salifodinae]MBP1986968.1 hypothetical protein [Halolamina salifodinae]
MKRRNYLTTVGGIALTPALSLGKTESETEPNPEIEHPALEPLEEVRLAPEEYKRLLPTVIGVEDGTLEVSHNEFKLGVGKLIRSYYSHDPTLRVTYTEKAENQVRAKAGGLFFYPDYLNHAASFLSLFDKRVEYRRKKTERFVFHTYTIDGWRATVRDELGPTEEHSFAVIDNDGISFKSREEKRQHIAQEVTERIFR